MSGDGASQDDFLQEHTPPLEGNTGYHQEGRVSPQNYCFTQHSLVPWLLDLSMTVSEKSERILVMRLHTIHVHTELFVNVCILGIIMVRNDYYYYQMRDLTLTGYGTVHTVTLCMYPTLICTCAIYRHKWQSLPS